MPGNPRGRPRRKGLKRSRRFRRKRGRIVSKVHHFTRTALIGNISGTTTNQYAAYSFKFSSIPDYTEFTALFDAYKITKITVMFMPDNNSYNVSTSGAPVVSSNLATVIDYNDATAPTSFTQLLTYDNYKMCNAWQRHTRVFRPKVSTAAFDGTNVVSSGVASPGWYATTTTATTDIQHYGLKWCLTASSATSLAGYQVFAKYHFSCKDVK